MVDYLTARKRFLDLLVEHHETVPKALLDSALDLMVCLNRFQQETALERAKRTGLEFWAKRTRAGSGEERSAPECVE